MFNAIAADRPYPSPALTGAKWREVRPKYVPIGELIATQNHLSIAALHPQFRTSHTGDRLVHVVKHGGRLYLEDGHHRVVRERLAGAEHVYARVLDLDRVPPTPEGDPAPASADDQADLPGLVWVEGKGYRSVHLARALEQAGGLVDWHRWSPGTSDREHAPLPYRDVA